ncbi:16S rRNA (guanine(527)-N(7))-methyltransferase RsmG [Paenibacillus sp. JTLBN-2024]
MDPIQEAFALRLQEKGVEVTSTQLEQFETYYRELVKWNEKMNLTGITDREQVYTKHFYDSISLAFYIDMNDVRTMADIGSGAGFPGIPLKICYPHVQLTIIDSLNKRINFLKHVVQETGLEQVQLCMEGPKTGHANRNIGISTTSSPRVPSPSSPYLTNSAFLMRRWAGGVFAAMKGSSPDEEIREASRSFKELKGKLQRVERLTLPIEEAERHIVVIDKTAATPGKYPRKAGTALKTPVVSRQHLSIKTTSCMIFEECFTWNIPLFYAGIGKGRCG